MYEPSPEELLELFLQEFLPRTAAHARQALAAMRHRFPGAFELVYDNYNALVIGFCPTEHPSSGIFSIVVYPRYVSLCFLKGAALDDPDHILKGAGNLVRHIRLEEGGDTLARPEVESLITAALDCEGVVPDSRNQGRTVIRSVSPNRRPRRPAMVK